ncbi:MAG: hypothetical protein ACKO0V_15820 [bacterium]
MPDKEGFAGMYAGITGKYLLAAGGANFPEGYPWEGGKKRWYDHIFAIDMENQKEWQKLIIKLPQAMGYGVYGTWNGLFLIAGGETGPTPGEPADKPVRILNQVVAIKENHGEFTITELPPLPKPLKDSCGTVVGDFLVVFGGISDSSDTIASTDLFMLDLKDLRKGWKKGPALPAPGRIQAVAATNGNRFYLFSGIEIEPDPAGKPARKIPYLKDAWSIEMNSDMRNTRWHKLPDMPAERAAAPSPAWFFNHQIAIPGGADSARHRLPQKDHPGWSGDMLIFDTLKEKWAIKQATFQPKQARVTAPGIAFQSKYLIISGEKSPGMRSPEILQLPLP